MVWLLVIGTWLLVATCSGASGSGGETAFFILAWLIALLISEGEIPSFCSWVIISVSDFCSCCIWIILSKVLIVNF